MALTPTVAPVGNTGAIINNRYTRLYNNPHFDYLTEMLPRDIKQLFQWCEIIYNNTPIIANGIRKLINYPVTDFSFESEAEDIRKLTRELITKIKLKTALLEFGNDYYVYGNVFRTLYMPFKRFLVCKRCKTEVAIEQAEVKIKKDRVIARCQRCGCMQQSEIKDRFTYDINNIKIVRWDPKLIEIASNPITGGVEYYYALPDRFRKAVKNGDINVLKDTPKIFIDAVFANKNVKMGTNFYHAKTGSLAGYASGWGISPLMPTLKGYMYIAVLRRAAESIGMEHITPQRILFPQGVSSDPAVMTDLSRWKTEVIQALERWRIDPNYVMTAPYPTGIVNIGSQGRALIPTEEIKDARMEMAMALDIPPGVIMGDTNIQHSAISLRIMENQLAPYTEQLTEFANWIILQINAHMKRKYCNIGLVPFKLADDIMNKQILMSAVGNMVSKTTVQEILNLDPDREAKRMMQDQLTDYDMQKETQQAIQKKEQNAAAQAQEAEQEQLTGMPSPYNQQKMIAMAQEQAMQMLQVPYEQRRSMLAQLQNEDYVMWALVSKQMETMRGQQGAEGEPQ